MVLMKDPDLRSEFNQKLKQLEGNYFKEPEKFATTVIKRLIKDTKLSDEDIQKGGVEADLFIGEKELCFIRYICTWIPEVEDLEEIIFLKGQFVHSQFETENGFVALQKESISEADLLAEKFECKNLRELSENKIFVKYCERCIRDAAAYLHQEFIKHREHKIGGLSTVTKSMLDFKPNSGESAKDFYFILELFLSITNDASKITDPLKKQYMGITFFHSTLFGTFANILSENKWTPNIYVPSYHEEVLKHAIITCVSTSALEEFAGDGIEKLEKSNLIRMSKITDMYAFVSKLYYSFIINMMASELKMKDFEAFCMLTSTEYEEVKFYEQQQKIEHLKRGASEKESMIHLLNQKLERLSKPQEEDLKSERDTVLLEMERKLRQTERMLDKANQKLQEQENRIKDASDQISDYEDQISILINRNQSKEKYTLQELENMNILLVGGHIDLLNALATRFPNWKVIEKPTDPFPDMLKLDKIVYFYKFISHTVYTSTIKKARALNIPIQYIDVKNYNQVIEKIREKEVG